MRSFKITVLAVLISGSLSAQNVGIGTNTPDASAKLEIESTTSGLLVPRMTTAQRTAIGTPATGLFVYDLTTTSFWVYSGAWVEIADTDSQTLSINGNNLTILGGNTVALPASTSVWTPVTVNSHYEIAQFPTDAEIRYGTTDLSGNNFNLGNGVFWGTNPGEDTGMFADGDQLILMSPGDNQLIQFWEEDSHTVRANISQAGAYAQVSDSTLKTNIEPIEQGLEKVMKLNGYTYEFLQSEEDIEKGQAPELGVGVLAQELIEVAPRLVVQSEQGHYLVNYDGLIPILIEATKEQQKKIEELESQLERLETLEKELEEIKALLQEEE